MMSLLSFCKSPEMAIPSGSPPIAVNIARYQRQYAFRPMKLPRSRLTEPKVPVKSEDLSGLSPEYPKFPNAQLNLDLIVHSRGIFSDRNECSMSFDSMQSCRDAQNRHLDWVSHSQSFGLTNCLKHCVLA
jgi:hypothetical protein